MNENKTTSRGDQYRMKLRGQCDKLFSQDGQYPKSFEFNTAVATVFDDMISRSVPLYKLTQELCVQYATEYAREHTNLYDLGCSTATSLELADRSLPTSVDFVGIDNSQAMLDKAQQKLARKSTLRNIRFICCDIRDCKISNASVVIMNYTLQFIALKHRAQILRTIYQGMTSHSLLFLSEKVQAKSTQIQAGMTSIYERFKAAQGYSRCEIERKKQALDNVLVPLTRSETSRLIEQAGFAHHECVIRWNNFASWVCLKDD